MEYTRLKVINEYISKNIAPAKTPGALFEMYSVPSFETGYPEYLLGSQIASNKAVVQKNDILLCKINPRINRVWVVADESEYPNIASSEWIVVRSSKYNPVFLAWYFRSPRFKHLMVSEVTGIGGSLTRAQPKAVAEYSVPVLPKAEQDAIAAAFNLVDTIIKKHQQQLQKLDELVKARFIELFIGKGYPTKTIDEVSLGKGEYGAQSASIEYDPTRPRYVRITDINDDGTLNDDVVASINPDDDEQYRLEYGDFLFARMGATVGKTFAFIAGNQIFAGYLIRYKLNQKLINPRYLFWYTKLDEYWNWVQLNQSGAAQPGINAKKYGSLKIPVPPIELQEQFAAFVEQTDKSKLAIQKSLEWLETLKQALMQKYFG